MGALPASQGQLRQAILRSGGGDGSISVIGTGCAVYEGRFSEFREGRAHTSAALDNRTSHLASRVSSGVHR